MMRNILEVASKITTPVMLAALVVIVLGLIFKATILKTKTINQGQSDNLLNKIVNGLLGIAFIAIFFAIAGYYSEKLIPILIEKPSKQDEEQSQTKKDKNNSIADKTSKNQTRDELLTLPVKELVKVVDRYDMPAADIIVSIIIGSNVYIGKTNERGMAEIKIDKAFNRKMLYRIETKDGSVFILSHIGQGNINTIKI